MAANSPVLIVGLGNDFRSDDRVGLYVARRLLEERLEGVDVLAGVGDALGLIERWNQAELVIIIDCAFSGAEAGKIYRFDALTEQIPEDLFSRFSTHVFSVVDALALAGALGQMPGRLLVYGIEAASCALGTEISPDVQRAAEEVISAIHTDIAAPLQHE